MAQQPNLDQIPALPVGEAERAAARRTVAANCVGATDARQLLDMLGLIDRPRQSGCRRCGGPLPLEALSPKCGLRGCCSRACRTKLERGES
ncbi:hypothetical protein [Nocardia sp. NPDC050793]|uniref:hypothetical protein n=1 Tax=Nocardia sp. NPDC050793 TaxID=3155159 RepID=UPI0033FA81E0